MNKKIIAFLLSLLLSAGSIVSCSNNKADSENDTKPSNAENTAPDDTSGGDNVNIDDLSSAEQRKLIPDNLPDTTFGGRDFLIGTTTSKEYEILSEELTGEVTNDSVYDRNIRLEDRFDIKIKSVITEAPYDEVKTVVTSGTYTYDIVGFINYLTYIPVTAGVLYNWCEIPYIDLSKPWHNSLANTDATINNKLFTINSDLSISTLLYTYGMFFNYSIMEDYGYSSADLYNIVFEGGWTMDKMYEITSQIWEDGNGNGKHDPTDIHGYAVSNGEVNTHDVWLAGLDISILEKNADGEYEATFFSEHTLEALEKVNRLYHESDGSLYDTTDDWRNIPKYFSNGYVAMTQLYFGETSESLGDMEDTYGILPLPKNDAEQENYYTNCWDQFTVFAIPATMRAEDADVIGIVYEALAAESYKYVYPAYYDQALKSRYSAEPTTAEIIDLIMAGRKLDFTFQFGGKLQDLPYIFRHMIKNNETDVASKYQKVRKALNKSIKSVIELYD